MVCVYVGVWGGGLIVCVGGLDNLVNMSANSLKLAWCVCQ